MKPTGGKKLFSDLRLAALYTLFVFVSLYFTPAVRDFLAHHFLLQSFVSGLYIVLVALGVGLLFYKYRITSPRAYLYFFCLFILFLLEFYDTKRLVERLHFLEYALLFAFWFRVFRHFVSPVLCHGATLAWCLLLSLLDEGVQYFLPNRHFDLQDIRLNVTGMLFGMGVVIIFFYYRRDKKFAQ